MGGVLSKLIYAPGSLGRCGMRSLKFMGGAGLEPATLPNEGPVLPLHHPPLSGKNVDETHPPAGPSRQGPRRCPRVMRLLLFGRGRIRTGTTYVQGMRSPKIKLRAPVSGDVWNEKLKVYGGRRTRQRVFDL